MEKRNLRNYLRERIAHKPFTAIVLAYSLFCVGSGVYFSCSGEARNGALAFAYLAIAAAVLLGEYLLRIRCGSLFVGGVLVLAAGSILGTCYNLYSLVPFFDLLLHTLAGVLFTALGFTVSELFFGESTGKKRFFGCLAFAVCFSLSIAVFWEFFEYACTAAFGFDMMEDSIVTGFNSYLLSGNHTEVVEIDGIIQTIIYYGDGATYVVEGYLDIGLIDTIGDMAVCALGAAVFAIFAVLAEAHCPRVFRALIPKREESMAGESVVEP